MEEEEEKQNGRKTNDEDGEKFKERLTNLAIGKMLARKRERERREEKGKEVEPEVEHSHTKET
jgi:hypothetical protein